jgi:hypothetical protein
VITAAKALVAAAEHDFCAPPANFPRSPGSRPGACMCGSLAVLSRRPCKRSQQRMAVPCGIEAPSASWGTATWRTNWLGYTDQCRARQAGWHAGWRSFPQSPGSRPGAFMYGSLAVLSRRPCKRFAGSEHRRLPWPLACGRGAVIILGTFLSRRRSMKIRAIFANNRAWAKAKAAKHPGYFSSLSR